MTHRIQNISKYNSYIYIKYKMDQIHDVKYVSSIAISIGFGVCIGWFLKGRFGKSIIMVIV